MSTKPVLSEQDQAYIASQFILGSSTASLTFQALLLERDTHLSNSDDINFEMQETSVIGNTLGLVFCLFLYRIYRKKFTYSTGLNPMWRVMSALASEGYYLGTSLASILPFPNIGKKISSTIFTNLLSFTFALFAIPYWFIRERVLNIPIEQKRNFVKLGQDGWSRYSKTFAYMGAMLGQLAGFSYAQASHSNIIKNMAIFGSISGASCFIAGLVTVPLINKYFSNALITKEKEHFRNNYVSSGSDLGVSLGFVFGFIAGTILFPGLGSLIGSAVGSAIGGILGGVILGRYGYRITCYMRDHFRVSKKTENTWDYSTRSMAAIFSSLGAVIGFLSPIPGGALAGAALGGAIGTAIGWTAGLVVMAVARKLAPDKPAESVSWTLRSANGSRVGFCVGALIGFSVGLVFGGPPGALAGAVLGGGR